MNGSRWCGTWTQTGSPKADKVKALVRSDELHARLTQV
jgi:hypothetical protein